VRVRVRLKVSVRVKVYVRVRVSVRVSLVGLVNDTSLVGLCRHLENE